MSSHMIARSPSPSVGSSASAASTVTTPNSPQQSSVAKAKACSSCGSVCDWSARACEICGDDFPTQQGQVMIGSTMHTPPTPRRKPWFFDISPKECFECNTSVDYYAGSCPICGSSDLVVQAPRNLPQKDSAEDEQRQLEKVHWNQRGYFRIRGVGGAQRQVALPMMSKHGGHQHLDEDASRASYVPPSGKLKALFHVVL